MKKILKFIEYAEKQDIDMLISFKNVDYKELKTFALEENLDIDVTDGSGCLYWDEKSVFFHAEFIKKK